MLRLGGGQLARRALCQVVLASALLVPLSACDDTMDRDRAVGGQGDGRIDLELPPIGVSPGPDASVVLHIPPCGREVSGGGLLVSGRNAEPLWAIHTQTTARLPKRVTIGTVPRGMEEDVPFDEIPSDERIYVTIFGRSSFGGAATFEPEALRSGRVLVDDRTVPRERFRTEAAEACARFEGG